MATPAPTVPTALATKKKGEHEHGASFMTRVSHGLPNWAWLVGGTTAGGGLIFGVIKLVRHFKRKR